jgi:hypothetical protein
MTSSKPKRPEVSIRGETYDKVKVYCQKQGITITEFVDRLCAEFFEEQDISSLDLSDLNVKNMRF